MSGLGQTLRAGWRRLRATPPRRLVLPIVAIAFALGGIVTRRSYALNSHHPRHFVWSDMASYMVSAQRLYDPDVAQNANDAIWPSGTGAVLGLFFAKDGSMQLAASVWLYASIAIVLLTALSAQLLAGRRAAWWALILAAFHVGLVHYTGYFLSELPFQLVTAIAVTASLLVLRRIEASAELRGRRLRLLAFASLLAGSCWGVAALFRPNALSVGAFVLLVLAIGAARRKRAALWLVGAALAGALIWIAPASARCTELTGKFCTTSSNPAINIAMGQAGMHHGLRFRNPDDPRDVKQWSPPGLLFHGYQGVGEVPAAADDTVGILRWVGERFSEDPWLFTVRAVGNALDLFSPKVWPTGASFPPRVVIVAGQLFVVFVVIPAVLACVRVLRTVRRRTARPSAVFAVAVFVGMVLTAMISTGEARYRIPFDIALIALATCVYPTVHRSSPPITRGRAYTAALAGVALLSVPVGLWVTLVSSPSIELGRSIEQTSELAFAPRIDEQDPKSLSKRRRNGAPWNEKGNYIFRCRPTCPELRVKTGRTGNLRSVYVAVDRNDRYRLRFYRDGRIVGHSDIELMFAGKGMRATRAVVPPDARHDPDAIGIVPLFGDGNYSVGHLIPEYERHDSR